MLLISSSALAQIATSSLTGRVNAGVTVTVTSLALQGERSTVATNTGRYWLTALPPGQYEVTFSKPRMQTVMKKVVLEVGRVGRLDAHLEPSDDEETITATAKTVSVTETTAVTTHFSDQTLDRLPYRRDPAVATFLGPDLSGGGPGVVDDAISLSVTHGQEALEQVTAVRAALPADYDLEFPPFSLARTRSGGEDLFLSLRDTITSTGWIANEPPFFEGGTKHLVEAAVGGRIVPQKLWFFADAWRGAEALLGDIAGYEAKLTAQAGPSHNLVAAYIDTRVQHRFSVDERKSTQASLRYTGTHGPRVTTEAVLSRSEFDFGTHIRQTSVFGKTTYIAGDHILSAGARITDEQNQERAGFFVNDRWVAGRATMNLGVRHDHDRFSPRLAATFDLLGNGRHAIAASASDYTTGFGFIRELTLGYAMAVGNTGTARVDAVRRDYGDAATEGLQADFIYSLFDRFHTGATYGWSRLTSGVVSGYPRHVANAWAGIDIPLGSHELGITLAGRYRSRTADFFGDDLAADLGLRYTLPISRAALTVAADVTNVFNRVDSPYLMGRAVRGWVRVRLLP